MGQVDKLGRQIAGLLTYNPGPGIYSRLERAVEAMPENVRVQELPGLLKRYKDGVPGWELKATDLDSTIAGRDVVPREELLGAVRERSPVYTHKEIVLGGNPQYVPDAFGTMSPEYKVSHVGEHPVGSGRPAGDPKYDAYGQGGDEYTEILLLQPGIQYHPGGFGSHWGGHPDVPRTNQAVAHARFDTHGDAMRINEIQSDLGIHNRKVREWQNERAGRPPATNSQALRDLQKVLPFPMEDAWADLMVKRLALEAARQGHRAIEIASPRAIADKVGGNIDNYEHVYGKVVPGALERLGRKMGGLTPDGPEPAPVVRPKNDPQYETHQQLRDRFREASGDDQPGPNFWRLYSGMRYDSLPPRAQAATYDRFGGSHPVSQVEGGLPQEMYDYLHRLGLSPEAAQGITSQAIYLAPHNANSMHNFAQMEQLQSLGGLTNQHVGEAGRRYLISDEMRRLLIQQGVGAAVAGGVLSQDELIERLGP
jgi:hypothetical protein